MPRPTSPFLPDACAGAAPSAPNPSASTRTPRTTNPGRRRPAGVPWSNGAWSALSLVLAKERAEAKRERPATEVDIPHEDVRRIVRIRPRHLLGLGVATERAGRDGERLAQH